MEGRQSSAFEMRGGKPLEERPLMLASGVKKSIRGVGQTSPRATPQTQRFGAMPDSQPNPGLRVRAASSPRLKAQERS